jgi:hypothetical protein
MTRDGVMEAIRRLEASQQGLFRVHRLQAALYARARRLFGSWSLAVTAAGLDYRLAIHRARRRALRSRRLRRRRRA